MENKEYTEISMMCLRQYATLLQFSIEVFCIGKDRHRLLSADIDAHHVTADWLLNVTKNYADCI